MSIEHYKECHDEEKLQWVASANYWISGGEEKHSQKTVHIDKIFSTHSKAYL